MKRLLILLFLYACATTISAQQNSISGVLKENSETLIGANVTVFRNGILQHGTITDIDGKYSIPCEVGDRLEFSYTGFTTKSVTVTREMLDRKTTTEQQNINAIESKAFKDKMAQRRAAILNAIKENSQKEIQIAQTQKGYLHHNTFVDFDIVNGKIYLEKTKQPIRYDFTISQKIGSQNVLPFHTHALQREFSQGRPINGTLTHQDHSFGESFSFGPKITDGSNTNLQSFDNNIFEAGITWKTKLNFKAEQDNKKIYGSINYERSPDIFNVYNNQSTALKVGFINFKDRWRQSNYLNVEFTARRFRVGNHNLTGQYQNVLKSMMIQSPSFDAQNGVIENVSFGPDYDHPVWLLQNNNNPILADNLNLTLNHSAHFGYEEHRLRNTLSIDYKRIKVLENYNQGEDRISNQLAVQTPSSKLISLIEVNLNEEFGLKMEIENIATAAIANFKTQNNTIESHTQSQQLLRNNTTAKWILNIENLNFNFGFNSLFSTNQDNEEFIPNFNLGHTFELYNAHIDKLHPYIGAQKFVKSFDLLLDRYNYSSLNTDHFASQDLRLNLPLWLPNDMENETKTEYKAGINVNNSYSKSEFNSRLEYKFIDQKNVIFPLFENNKWTLRNAADYTLHNISWLTTWTGRKKIFKKQIHFTNTFEISHFQTNVNKLHGTSDIIPIAGYSNVSKNLIVDQPVGIIVGSDFLRTENGDRIIGEDGFPIQSDALNVIADPTPLFSFSYGQDLKIGNYSLDILVDGQIGGKVWNGTQQTLDYYGVSKNSADTRTITDYVFEGVDLEGNINTTKVAFADPNVALSENRWTRYGKEGIASDYIRDASHIRLKSIELSYHSDMYQSHHISKLSVYAKNLLTLASFQGYSNSHLYEDSIARGLQYFNQPNATEIGISLTYKL